MNDKEMQDLKACQERIGKKKSDKKDDFALLSDRYYTKERPFIYCEECGALIEPIENNDGFLKIEFQPKFCEKHSDIIKDNINVRSEAIKIGAPRKLVLKVDRDDMFPIDIKLLLCEVDKGESIYINGINGSGKTYLATTLLLYGLADYNWSPESVKWVSLDRLIDIYLRHGEKELINFVTAKKMIISFGEFRGDNQGRDGMQSTQAPIKTILLTLDKRIDLDLQTILVTVYSLNEIRSTYSDAVAGRIAENFHEVQLPKVNRREIEMKKKLVIK